MVVQSVALSTGAKSSREHPLQLLAARTKRSTLNRSQEFFEHLFRLIGARTKRSTLDRSREFYREFKTTTPVQGVALSTGSLLSTAVLCRTPTTGR